MGCFLVIFRMAVILHTSLLASSVVLAGCGSDDDNDGPQVVCCRPTGNEYGGWCGTDVTDGRRSPGGSCIDLPTHNQGPANNWVRHVADDGCPYFTPPESPFPEGTLLCENLLP